MTSAKTGAQTQQESDMAAHTTIRILTRAVLACTHVCRRHRVLLEHIAVTRTTIRFFTGSVLYTGVLKAWCLIGSLLTWWWWLKM